MNFLSISIERAGYGPSSFYEPFSTMYEGNRCLVLVGPGGSGKTTLLKLICKDTDENLWIEGSISINSNRLFVMPQNFPAEDRISFTQDQLSFLHTYWNENSKVASNLNKYNGMLVSELPKGIRKLALFSRYIVDGSIDNADFLLLDEPEAGLDHALVCLLANKIQFLREQKFVIVSTHHIAFMEMIANDIIFFKYGRLIVNQRSEDFFSSDNEEVKYLIQMGC